MRTLMLLAALVVAAVVPSAAPAATWHGVVVAKDAARSTVATATSGGVVHSIRSPAVRSLAVGDRVAVRAERRADGRYTASRIRRTGHAAAATVRGTVITHQRRLGRTILSAGGSVVSVRRPTAARVPALAGADTGDVVSASVRIRAGRLAARRVVELGRADVLELRGIYLDVEGGVLRVAVVKQGLVRVRIPEGVTKPSLSPGDLVVVVATVDEEGALVLVSLKRDAKDRGDKGVEVGENEVTVRGTIASLAPASLAVRPGAGASPVECAVAEGAPLVAFFPGDEVELHCRLVDGRFRLEYLSGKSAWLKVRDGVVRADFGLHGVLTELGADAVAVAVRGRPISCVRPSNAELAAFAVATEVKLGCTFENGAFRLSFLKSASASWFAGEKGEAPTGEMTIEGTLEALTSTEASIRSPLGLFTCSHANAGLAAIFPTGQQATMRCRLGATGWRLVKLYSGNAWVIVEP